MDSATAVKGLMEHAYTFAPPTTRIQLLVNFCAPQQPLKQVTIPRLELCAATLLAKLYKKAICALNTTINVLYLWTDSSIVLTWIQGPPNTWKIFVGNRVAIIQEETASATWRHVPTQSNPADLLSREAEPTTLSTSTLWWRRPQWLTQEPFSWPTTEFNTPTENLEVRNVHVAFHLPEDITLILQAEQTHQSHCILQKIHKQLQTYQGQQANSHSDHTRSRPSSDLLCEGGTTDFICTRNQGLDGTSAGCNYQFSQDTAYIY